MRVVVVGAGPAGCAAAISATRRGANVTLIDRAVFPRDKPCGDVLASGAVETLRELGADDVVRAGRPFRSLRFRHAGHPAVTAHERPTRGAGIVLRRRDMDAMLLRLTSEIGVRVVQGVRVVEATISEAAVSTVTGVDTVRGSARFFDADTVIAADGSASGLRARLLGRPCPDTAGLAARVYVNGYPNTSSLDFVMPLQHDGSDIRGYGWAFPLGNGVGNVGVGVFPGVAGARLAPISQLLDNFLTCLRTTPQFAALGPVERPRSGLIRAWEHVPLGPQNVLLVGDAGGLVNPVTGEGIYAALESGRVAGEIAAAGGDQLAERYVQKVSHLQAGPFRVLRAAPWQLSGPILETARAGLSAVRGAVVEAFADGMPTSPPTDAIDEALIEALTSAPPLLRRTVGELRRDRDDPVSALFRATLGSAATRPDCETAALIALLDIQAALAQDVRRDPGEDVADTFSLMLADMMAARALGIGGQTGRRLCVDFAARLAAAGIGFEFASVAARAEHLFTLSGLSGEFAGRYLAGRGAARGAPEDALVSECGAVTALHHLAWMGGQLRLWKERGTHRRDLPSWAADGVASARELLLATHAHVPRPRPNAPPALRSLRATAEARLRAALDHGQ